eukprot:scaffold213242_cov15-Prasinocladus_malaysianus.AAC.1
MDELKVQYGRSWLSPLRAHRQGHEPLTARPCLPVKSSTSPNDIGHPTYHGSPAYNVDLK